MARPRQFDENEVLDKALALFWEKGYHATSVRDLVDVLGINRASLYDTFGDKQALYKTALAHYRARNMAVLEEIMSQPIPIYDRLKMVFSLLFKVAEQPDEVKGCFMVNSTIEFGGQDEQICDLLQQNYSKFLAQFGQWFREAKEKALFPADKSPEDMARYFYTVYNGLQVVARLNNKSEDLRISAREALEPFRL